MKEQPLSSSELQLFSRRDLIIRSAISLPFIGLIWRLWDLQAIQGKKFAELSHGNRIRVKSIAAPRGILYDRNMEILAKNIPSYNLVIVREDCPDIERVLRKVSYTLKIPYAVFQRKLQQHKRTAKFKPVTLFENLTWYQMSLVNAYQEEFPGISVDHSSLRYYPKLHGAVHTLGYMSIISEEQLEKLPAAKLRSAEMVGQDGIEKRYNDVLIGTDGGVQIEVDSVGRTIKTLESISAVQGHDIRLTLDMRLQSFIEKNVNYKNGSIIVMKPKTGDILAIVSNPGFDPNPFSRGLNQEAWQAIKNHPDHVLRNRSIQGLYSPGSTFKMLIASIGLEMGIITEDSTYRCDGHWRVGRDNPRYCWKRSGHGDMNAKQAIENSCNVFFYKLGHEIGVDKINEYAEKFGFNKITGVNLENELSGLIPSSEWKQKALGKIWYPGETLSVAIGQGYVTTTPLQLVSYLNVFLNGGYWVKPRIVDEVLPLAGQDPEVEAEPLALEADPVERRFVGLDPETIRIIREGMAANVESRHGTGHRAYSRLVSIGGKTGTTQVISNKTRSKFDDNDEEVPEKYLDHSWFVGYAPAEEPEISAVVLLEHGESGKYAAQELKKIVNYYYTHISKVPEKPDMDIENEEKTT